jgi:hypothetical protein
VTATKLCCVVLSAEHLTGAIFVHYAGVIKFFEWRIHNECPI